MNQNQILSNPENGAGDVRVAALRAQVVALRNQRRSGTDFVEWKPDIFY